MFFFFFNSKANSILHFFDLDLSVWSNGKNNDLDAHKKSIVHTEDSDTFKFFKA